MAITNQYDSTLMRNRALDKGISKSEINQVFRVSLVDAVNHWIENYLDLHFSDGATQRYRYAARDARYRAKKQMAEKVRVTFGPDKGQYVPPARPTGPLVYTGRLREHVLSNKYQYSPSSTSKFSKKEEKQVVTVRVPIGLPHPINPKNSGEITRMNSEEYRTLRSITFRTAKRKLRDLAAELLAAKGTK